MKMEDKFDRLEKMIDLVLANINKTYFGSYTRQLRNHTDLLIQFRNVMNLAIKILPDHQDVFTLGYEQSEYLTENASKELLRHIKDIITIERISVAKISELKLFESAEEKIKQSSVSFRNDQFTSVFHNLNSAIELALKEKLDIPITIPSINTSKVIDILVKEKIGPFPFLTEVRDRVIFIDNKIKHQGYLPNKIESINAIKATTDLFNKIKQITFNLSNDVKNKIYDGL